MMHGMSYSSQALWQKVRSDIRQSSHRGGFYSKAARAVISIALLILLAGGCASKAARPVTDPVAAPAAGVLSTDITSVAQYPAESMVLATPLTDAERVSRPREATSALPWAPANAANPVIQVVRPTIASKPAFDDPSASTEYVLPLAKVRSRPSELPPITSPAGVATEVK
jgi:hypothetical protein